MAECHPVGFQWVMEAKARGAKLIHVDPRFTRTSALADMHVPLRAGSDIVFIGGIINYVLANEKYFRDYVVNYTNAATLLTEDFQDTEDLDGVFSGLDREHRTYDFEAWRYQGAEMSAAAGHRDRPDQDNSADDRQSQHLRDRGRADQRRLPGVLPVRGEPGGRLGERPDAAAWPGQPGLAGGPRSGHDRKRHLLAERAGDRDSGDPDAGHRHRGILPAAAAHTEKNGSFTNTQRMLQWHHQAVEPAGDARSDLWFAYHLGRRLREAGRLR